MPVAGIPHHAAERYCAELIRRGYSVASAINGDNPAKGALLKRGITRVLTPGTVLEGMLAPAATTGWPPWWWSPPPEKRLCVGDWPVPM